MRMTTMAGAFCVFASLGLGTQAWADLVPIAINAYGGAGVNAASGSTTFGVSVGADVGYKINDWFSIVALGEYAPVLTNISTSNGVLTVGGGLRFDPPIVRLVAGGGYSQSLATTGNSNLSGFGLKALAFFPLFVGFGPYVELGFHSLSASSVTAASAGISFSY